MNGGITIMTLIQLHELLEKLVEGCVLWIAVLFTVFLIMLIIDDR